MLHPTWDSAELPLPWGQDQLAGSAGAPRIVTKAPLAEDQQVMAAVKDRTRVVQ